MLQQADDNSSIPWGNPDRQSSSNYKRNALVVSWMVYFEYGPLDLDNKKEKGGKGCRSERGIAAAEKSIG